MKMTTRTFRKQALFAASEQGTVGEASLFQKTQELRGKVFRVLRAQIRVDAGRQDGNVLRVLIWVWLMVVLGATQQNRPRSSVQTRSSPKGPTEHETRKGRKNQPLTFKACAARERTAKLPSNPWAASLVQLSRADEANLRVERGWVGGMETRHKEEKFFGVAWHGPHVFELVRDIVEAARSAALGRADDLGLLRHLRKKERKKKDARSSFSSFLLLKEYSVASRDISARRWSSGDGWT